MMQLIEAIRTPVSSTKISLPEFNPEQPDADPRAWCATIDICVNERPLEGASLIIALSKALKGSASSWLSQISHAGMTWQHFRELFLARYDSTETLAATLIGVNNGKPKDGECLAAYASRVMTSLLTRWKDLSHEEIAASYVLAHIAQFDSRLYRLAFTSEVKTRNKLLQEVKASASLKRKYDRNNGSVILTDGSDVKRFKSQNVSATFKCHNCGKPGHKAVDCRSKFVRQTVPSANKGLPKSIVTAGISKQVICFRCGESGHIASKCHRGNAGAGNSTSAGRAGHSSGSGAVAVQRADVCTVAGVCGELQQSGKSYYFCFDSGAECSLVKQTVSRNFIGKRTFAVIRIQGIGYANVDCTEQILCDVLISGSRLSILFHVLPDDCLKYDVMIGREILKQGFTISMSESSLIISKQKSVATCAYEPESVFSLDDIDTDIQNKEPLLSLLKAFSHAFIDSLPRTRVTSGELIIRLQDPNRTVYRRPYRLSSDERQIVRSKVRELMEANIIRPSQSPFASPILLVKKRDGSDRMVVDYRELNSNTVPDRFPLPLIADQLARLSGASFYTCLDCASGFNQIPIKDPDSIERTAFITPDGQFEYLAMPFGLRNAPSVFQRAVSSALGDLVFSYVVLYLDDILIPSVSEEQGLCRLREVLEALTKAGFSLNISKCSFLKRRVEFLGYDIAAGELRPNPRKIEALTKLPPPQNIHELRQFIGLASYFRKFIKSFSQIMTPLFLLVTNKQFTWNPEHERIRQQIISVLTTKPVLTIFNPDLPTELHTDASASGYGAILFQKTDDQLLVVEYFSKRTTKAESKYHSYELETLAVVNAVKHFRHYLQGRHFEVVTDCNSLKASRNKVDITPRVHRWWAFLQAFDFQIRYREGRRMAHVDFLSRNALPSPDIQSVSKVEQKRVDLATLSANWLLAEQLRDQEIQSLVTKLNEGQLPPQICKTYEMRSGILHRKVQRNNRTRCLPIVPRAFRWSVINHVHESLMHFGWEKTLDRVYEHYWFEHMAKYVRKFVDGCITCKVSKSHSGRVQAELHPIPKISVPWHTVHVDITGKLSGKNDSKEYVIVLIDAFTKFVLMYHTLRIDAASVIKAVKSSVFLFGAPTRIVADQGRCFASKDFKDFCESHGISLHLIATGSSRANGQVERVMSTLKGMLTSVETSDRSWQEALDDVQLALNCSVHRVTGASPLELMIGQSLTFSVYYGQFYTSMKLALST
ncbi:unnamed protein product [Euphydryas editha]|uniref:RNA-directed DNA polymerase n=1 Tax=Euphydryas editha TaxID=104508 RepID=A0AAU9V1P3_EUPED|nr:unnamed protein product [Euphydryas editha]